MVDAAFYMHHFANSLCLNLMDCQKHHVRCQLVLVKFNPLAFAGQIKQKSIEQPGRGCAQEDGRQPGQ